MGNLPRLLSGEFDNLHADIAQFIAPTTPTEQMVTIVSDVAHEIVEDPKNS